MTDKFSVSDGVSSSGQPSAVGQFSADSIRPNSPFRPDLVFFDGQCGLCHASVRFVLRHEGRSPARPSFAPLQGETFQRMRPDLGIESLPDSLIVFTAGGRTLVRSDATLHLLMGLGGGWRVLGRIGKWCPRPVRDGIYRIVAAIRRRVLPAPVDACSVVSQDSRDRFLP